MTSNGANYNCRFLPDIECPNAAVPDLFCACGDCLEFEKVADVQRLKDAFQRCRKTMSECEDRMRCERDDFTRNSDQIEAMVDKLCLGDPTAHLAMYSNNPQNQNLVSRFNQLAEIMLKMDNDSLEMAIGLCEHYDALIKLAHGQFDVRAPEDSPNELIAKLGSLINEEARTLLTMIEELQHTENKLMLSHQKMQDIVEFLPDATFVIDADKRVIAWNHAMELMTGVDKTEMLGKGYYEYGTPFYGSPQKALIDFIDDDTSQFSNRYQNIERKGNVLFAETFLPRFHGEDGLQIWITASPLFDREGNRVGAIESVRDITDWKRAVEERQQRTRDLEEKTSQLLATQKELYRAERLAGLGLLAAGVAHEINNPLAVIRGNAELLQSSLPKESENREEADAIVEEAIRIERIVNNLRVFSRNGMKRVSTFSLGKMLDAILNKIGHQISLDCYRVMRDYRKGDLEIGGDRDQLRQVFTNLIINGLQAMPEGGDLMVRTEPDQSDQQVMVTVQDSGCGIPDKDKERLFTPFFSTKARGTGLGLAVSYGIVRDHGGDIRFESRAGEGATFMVLLPLRQEAVEHPT